MSKKYTIHLNERQLRLLAYACRVTDRLIIGQLDFSLQECCETAWERKEKERGVKYPGLTEEWRNMRDEVEYHIQALVSLCWGLRRHELNGVGYNKDADTLFDMQKVMEHAMWLAEPEDTRSQFTNSAFAHEMTFGTEPNIKIEEKQDE